MQDVAGDTNFYINSDGYGESVLFLIIRSIDGHRIAGVDRWLLRYSGVSHPDHEGGNGNQPTQTQPEENSVGSHDQDEIGLQETEIQEDEPRDNDEPDQIQPLRRIGLLRRGVGLEGAEIMMMRRTASRKRSRRVMGVTLMFRSPAVVLDKLVSTRGTQNLAPEFFFFI
ncbi:hypothetical protein F2Q70_00011871 [Brassica cretica]|uniref:Uncharacterized protein n=1 Tax=Brassica cretica TaxID=69181 RepID=A0A8S9LRD9_BRACR|nr:hypothetical protein F2Q70_00011871 [Brassica cretica]